MKPMYRLLFAGYVISSVCLFLFSYTQVDLNLTLSRVSIWQGIQTTFQHIGFYARPLAAGIFSAILFVLSVAYIVLLRGILRKDIQLSFVVRLIAVVTAVLLFSYPAAFSYDIFNYMFTAKTVLVYHQNPYTVLPQQFSGLDPWTNFMRWTHLPSAYTPLWILMTLPPFAAGLGYFLPVMFGMKLMVAVWYGLLCLLTYRILKKEDPPRAVYGLAFVALNPLIIIETLVSAHNDILLSALAVLSVWLYVRGKMYASVLVLAASVAAKLMTITLFPVLLLKKSRGWFALAMVAGLAAVLVRREFLPWYGVWIVPFAALIPRNTAFVRAVGIASVALAASYLPYIYFGEYSGLMQTAKTAIIWSGVTVSAIVYLISLRGESS